MPPKWPNRAARALVKLFHPLQDIDIYVEDKDSQPFYEALIKQIKPPGLKVARVFPLNGRGNVINHALSHNFASRRAIFLIDGDFEWVRDEPAPQAPGLYRLNAYCIENLLICEHAATQLLIELRVCTENEASQVLGFQEWLRSTVGLVDLFVVWATLNKLDSTIPTTSLKIQKFLDGNSGRPQVDYGKMAKAKEDAINIIKTYPDGQILLDTIRHRVSTLSFPLDVASGKDFVLPALEFHMKAYARERCSTASLKLRLARHVKPERFAGLSRALRSAALGEILNQHSISP